MGFWDFHQTADAHWQWRYVSDNSTDCVYSGRFRSRNDCIADAMRHGYLSNVAPTDTLAAQRKDLQREPRVTPFLHRLLTS